MIEDIIIHLQNMRYVVEKEDFIEYKDGYLVKGKFIGILNDVTLLCTENNGEIYVKEKETMTLKIVGACKNPNKIQLFVDRNSTTFYSSHIFNESTFNELFNYLSNDWDDIKYATLFYDRIDENDFPINPIIYQITTKL